MAKSCYNNEMQSPAITMSSLLLNAVEFQFVSFTVNIGKIRQKIRLQNAKKRRAKRKKCKENDMIRKGAAQNTNILVVNNDYAMATRNERNQSLQFISLKLIRDCWSQEQICTNNKRNNTFGMKRSNNTMRGHECVCVLAISKSTNNSNRLNAANERNWYSRTYESQTKETKGSRMFHITLMQLNDDEQTGAHLPHSWQSCDGSLEKLYTHTDTRNKSTRNGGERYCGVR